MLTLQKFKRKTTKKLVEDNRRLGSLLRWKKYKKIDHLELIEMSSDYLFVWLNIQNSIVSLEKHKNRSKVNRYLKISSGTWKNKFFAAISGRHVESVVCWLLGMARNEVSLWMERHDF